MTHALHDILRRIHQSCHEGPVPEPLDRTTWPYYEQALLSAMVIRLGPDGAGLDEVARALAQEPRGENTP